MIAEINRKELEKAVKLAVKCLDRKSFIPVLNCIRLTFEPNQLTICGTNLDQTLNTTISASKVKDDLDICVDGHLFANLLSKLDDETVKLDFYEDKKNLIISRKSGDVNIRTLPADQFPELPKPEKTNFIKFQTYDLKNTFKAILCGTREDSAITSSISNIAEFTVETNLIESKFTCFSTDTYRLAIIKGLCEKADETNKELLKFQFPIYAVRLLLPTLQLFEKDFESISFGEDKNHIFVKFGDNLYYTFRKVTGQFPDIAKFLNALKFVADINLERDSILSSIETVALFTDDRTQSIKFDILDDALTLKACDADRGEIEETLDISEQKEQFEVSFNANYLMPILRQSEGDLMFSFAKQEVMKRVFNEETQSSTQELDYYSYPLRVSPASNGVSVDFYIQPLRF